MVLALGSPARADRPKVKLQLEAGSEADTNVHRTTTGGVPAAGGRLTTRFGLGWKRDRHTLVLDAVAAARTFFAPAEASEEDVLVLSGDARYDVAVGPADGPRPLALGARLSYYDAIERPTSDAGRDLDHDFRTFAGAGAMTLLTDGGARVVATAGYRVFTYKPNRAFDFAGETAGLSFTHPFPLGKDDQDSLEVTLSYAAARRRYQSAAIANVCADDAALAATCLMTTDRLRSDLFHAAGIEASYLGSRIYTVRYQLHLNDSTSFGQSLLRNRLELAITSEVVWDIVVTAKAVLQWHHFLDPVLLSGDIGTFLTIEDESRNAFVLHAVREFGDLTLEARYAFYANELGGDLPFRRHTLYLGLVYALP